MLATPKQTQFAASLLNDREHPEGYALSIAAHADGTLTKRDASALIDALLKSPRAGGSKATPEAEVPEGIHYLGGEYRKAYRTQKGYLVAKVWDAEYAEWEYVGKRGLSGLSEGTKATAEQAAAFGHTYGACCFCSRTLTDERSLTVGYGPVCAETNGLPWGEVAPVTVPDTPASLVTTQEEQEVRDAAPVGESMPDFSDEAYWASLAEQA